MTKGHAVLSYAEQEEIAARILGLAPGTSVATMQRLFRENWGIEFTTTNHRRAKERLGLSAPAERSDKMDYIAALFRIHPSILDAEVRAKTRLYFGEDTRGDLIREMRGLEKLISPEEATQVIDRCEARVARPPTIDLSIPETGDADLEKPT